MRRKTSRKDIAKKYGQKAESQMRVFGESAESAIRNHGKRAIEDIELYGESAAKVYAKGRGPLVKLKVRRFKKAKEKEALQLRKTHGKLIDQIEAKGINVTRFSDIFGNSGFRVAKKYGPEGIDLLLNHGPFAARVVEKHGDRAIPLIKEHPHNLRRAYELEGFGGRALDIAEKFGQDGLHVINRYGPKGADILEKHGEEALQDFRDWGILEYRNNLVFDAYTSPNSKERIAELRKSKEDARDPRAAISREREAISRKRKAGRLRKERKVRREEKRKQELEEEKKRLNTRPEPGRTEKRQAINHLAALDAIEAIGLNEEKPRDRKLIESIIEATRKHADTFEESQSWAMPDERHLEIMDMIETEMGPKKAKLFEKTLFKGVRDYRKGYV